MKLSFFENYILENSKVKLLPLQKEHVKELIKISKGKNQ